MLILKGEREEKNTGCLCFVIIFIIFTILLFPALLPLVSIYILIMPLLSIYILISIVPSIALAVRRMHDTNHSGWFMLIPICNFILSCTNGDIGFNKYGKDPKEEIQ